jgi:hypothetical protein
VFFLNGLLQFPQGQIRILLAHHFQKLPFQTISPCSNDNGIMMSKFNKAVDAATTCFQQNTPLLFPAANNAPTAMQSNLMGATSPQGVVAVDQLAQALN